MEKEIEAGGSCRSRTAVILSDNHKPVIAVRTSQVSFTGNLSKVGISFLIIDVENEAQ